MQITEPIEVLNEFLRANVDEITRIGVANRQTTDSQSFNGTGSATDFTLTLQPLCINSVTVGGTTQVKYLDYEIDLDNKTISFATAPAIGTDNIVVSFDKGINWIYPDHPRQDLKKTNYPRIGITHLTESSENTGMGETESYDNLTFQIDVVGYKDQLCTVGSDSISDADVVQYLARQIIKKIKRNRDNIYNKIYDPLILNNFPVPFEDDKHIIRRIIEVRYKTNNAGE